MEARINSYIMTSKGVRIISIFGYATKGLIGLEIHGMGKLSKNLKEKIIFLTKTRGLFLPKRRYVICVDLNGLSGDEKWQELKGLEFPTLLLYWYLGGIIPIKKLDDCVCQGWINAKGDIFQLPVPGRIKDTFKERLNPVEYKSLKTISSIHEQEDDFLFIDTQALLEHIPMIQCQSFHLR